MLFDASRSFGFCVGVVGLAILLAVALLRGLRQHRSGPRLPNAGGTVDAIPARERSPRRTLGAPGVAGSTALAT
jgi:hypothetical protein